MTISQGEFFDALRAGERGQFGPLAKIADRLEALGRPLAAQWIREAAEGGSSFDRLHTWAMTNLSWRIDRLNIPAGKAWPLEVYDERLWG